MIYKKRNVGNFQSSRRLPLTRCISTCQAHWKCWGPSCIASRCATPDLNIPDLKSSKRGRIYRWGLLKSDPCTRRATVRKSAGNSHSPWKIGLNRFSDEFPHTQPRSHPSTYPLSYSIIAQYWPNLWQHGFTPTYPFRLMIQISNQITYPLST